MHLACAVRTGPVARDLAGRPAAERPVRRIGVEPPKFGSGSEKAYTLDAVDVGRGFSYRTRTASCASTRSDRSRAVAADALVSDSISFLGAACPNDQSTFTFAAGATSIGSLTYSEAEATASPPYVASLGGCELDPITGTALASAERYITADGCVDGRVLTAPFQAGIERGAVLEAQVDGGIAEAAPQGTAIDFVINGALPAPPRPGRRRLRARRAS